MKKKIKRVSLSKDAIRSLSTRELRSVVGGTGNNTFTNGSNNTRINGNGG